MFSCPDGPYRTSGEATQKDAALVIIDAQEIIAECKSKLATLKELVK